MFTASAGVLVGILGVVATGDDFAREVVVLTNLERVKAGLVPLQVGVHEAMSAKWLAEDSANAGASRHIDSLGRGFGDRAKAFGIPLPLGENSAAGFRTPQTLVCAWLGSPKHRTNMLHPDAKRVGVGHAKRKTGLGHYWIMVLADADDVGVRR